MFICAVGGFIIGYFTATFPLCLLRGQNSERRIAGPIRRAGLFLGILLAAAFIVILGRTYRLAILNQFYRINFWSFALPAFGHLSNLRNMLVVFVNAFTLGAKLRVRDCGTLCGFFLGNVAYVSWHQCMFERRRMHVFASLTRACAALPEIGASWPLFCCLFLLSAAMSWLKRIWLKRLGWRRQLVLTTAVG